MRKTKGSTYIFVLVIAATVSIMLSMAVKMTKFEADVSYAYTNNANLYFLAESGVYKGLGAINEVVLSIFFESMTDPLQKVIIADEFLREYIGIDNSNHYFELIKYEIETLHKDSTDITYYITVYIKSDYNRPSYTIMSVAENEETVVKILGYTELVYGLEGVITAELTLLRQIDA